MSRCTGHCCRRFPLPISLEELRERQAQPNPGPGVVYARPKVQDGDYIADMLIALGDGFHTNGEKCWYFTCRHHDVHTGNCLAYESRPAMCKDYPYGHPCQHDGCTAVNRGLTQISGLKADYLIRDDPHAPDVASAIAEQMVKPLPTTAPDHRPGQRKPGFKATPPVPRWARKRQQRSRPSDRR